VQMSGHQAGMFFLNKELLLPNGKLKFVCKAPATDLFVLESACLFQGHQQPVRLS